MQLLGHAFLFREPELIRTDVQLSHRYSFTTVGAFHAATQRFEHYGHKFMHLDSTICHMGNAIWIVTIIAHVVILAILIYRMIYLPWFTFTVLAGLLESPYLFLVMEHGSKNSYYYAFYGCDILNIGLYCLAIRECYRYLYLNTIAFSMMTYLVPKLSAYGAMALHLKREAGIIHNLLLPANIACLFTWLAVIAMYSKGAPQTYSGDFMEPIKEELPVTPAKPEHHEPECPDDPKPPVHVEDDPGAPAPAN